MSPSKMSSCVGKTIRAESGPFVVVDFPKEKLTLLNITHKNVTPAWEILVAPKGDLLLL